MDPQINKHLKPIMLLWLSLIVVGTVNQAQAQSSAFTYQGRLQDTGANANGSYDFQFTLWDSLSGGTQQPQPTPLTVTKTSVAVSSGVFTVQLDFGATAFPGANRFLEISTRLAGGGAFTILSPRQPINSTPYAVRSASAALADTATTATNATQLGGVAANQYVLTGDSRLSDSRPPTAGSSNYIQNATSQQAGSNFNISGNGAAGGALSGNVVNAATQYNIGGSRFATATGQGNTFVGLSAGQSNTTGSENSFFGTFAGFNNTAGDNNSFFGAFAGDANTGSGNSLFGRGAGRNTTTGLSNSYFGFDAGFNNATGAENSFFGSFAGFSNTTGIGNSFFGEKAGLSNTSENNNTFIGNNSNGATGITNATAIGSDAVVSQSNSLVLGNNANVGIGTSSPVSTLDALPSGGKNVLLGGGANTGSEIKLTNSGTQNFSIYNSGNGNLTIARTSTNFVTNVAGTPLMSITSGGAIGIGTTTPGFMLHVNGETRTNTLSIDNYVSNSGGATLCASTSTNRVGLCSSSLRYKTNVQTFRSGLDIINRLRPISFNWKDGGMHDIGLAAEEVDQVEPLLAFRDHKGEIEGVRYMQLSAVFINAFKEQQSQIEEQRDEIAGAQARVNHQQRDIERLVAANDALNTRLRAVEKRVSRKPPARSKH